MVNDGDRTGLIDPSEDIKSVQQEIKTGPNIKKDEFHIKVTLRYISGSGFCSYFSSDLRIIPHKKPTDLSISRNCSRITL